MMKTYLISYELSYPEYSPQYTALLSTIKTATYWAKPFKCIWLIKTTLDQVQVLDQLRKVAYSNDKILVVEISNSWASVNLPSDVVSWMKGM